MSSGCSRGGLAWFSRTARSIKGLQAESEGFGIRASRITASSKTENPVVDEAIRVEYCHGQLPIVCPARNADAVQR